jgi:hypothetical protein
VFILPSRVRQTWISTVPVGMSILVASATRCTSCTANSQISRGRPQQKQYQHLQIVYQNINFETVSKTLFSLLYLSTVYQ